MDSIDQFFDFVERGEHALINLNPHFVLVPIYTRIVPLFVHAVYGSDNFTLTYCSHTYKFRCRRTRSAKIYCATRTEDLGQLVVSTSTAARSPARESPPATRTITIATGFLRTRFVDLERTALDIQAVEFSNGLCRVIFRPEFD